MGRGEKGDRQTEGVHGRDFQFFFFSIYESLLESEQKLSTRSLGKTHMYKILRLTLGGLWVTLITDCALCVCSVAQFMFDSLRFHGL